MPRWTQRALDEMTSRIGQLGLKTCNICGSGGFQVIRMPAVIPISSTNKKDPLAGVLYGVIVQCSTCGQMLMFNSEAFYRSTEGVLTTLPFDKEP
jgi:hypothetical protein